MNVEQYKIDGDDKDTHYICITDVLYEEKTDQIKKVKQNNTSLK